MSEAPFIRDIFFQSGGMSRWASHNVYIHPISRFSGIIGSMTANQYNKVEYPYQSTYAGIKSSPLLGI